MTRELHCLHYGEQEIRYEIVRRPRKTLEIAVEPDASVVITAPEDATLDAIEAKLRKRAAWVTRQQRYFAQFLPRTPERQFVAGETHLYLGRQYRLKVIPHVDCTPRICELVRYYTIDVTLKGAWEGPAGLELHQHALAPVAELPVLEVVSAVHLLTDLTLGLGEVVHDYLA